MFFFEDRLQAIREFVFSLCDREPGQRAALSGDHTPLRRAAGQVLWLGLRAGHYFQFREGLLHTRRIHSGRRGVRHQQKDHPKIDLLSGPASRGRDPSRYPVFAIFFWPTSNELTSFNLIVSFFAGGFFEDFSLG